MKHYNDFLIVGIDHGYGNIKTAKADIASEYAEVLRQAIAEYAEDIYDKIKLSHFPRE